MITKRDAIIRAAYRLFKQNGFYATGVDQIMRESAVSKRTLYKYFATKNELIVAVLEHYRIEYQKHLSEVTSQAPQDAKEQIKLIFNDAANWFSDVNFHGCLAVNAMGEFSGKDQAIEQACQCFKQWELAVITELCRQFNNKQAESLAYKLFILLEGMGAVAQVKKSDFAVDMTAFAEEIIAAHSG